MRPIRLSVTFSRDRWMLPHINYGFGAVDSGNVFSLWTKMCDDMLGDDETMLRNPFERRGNIMYLDEQQMLWQSVQAQDLSMLIPLYEISTPEMLTNPSSIVNIRSSSGSWLAIVSWQGVEIRIWPVFGMAFYQIGSIVVVPNHEQ